MLANRESLTHFITKKVLWELTVLFWKGTGWLKVQTCLHFWFLNIMILFRKMKHRKANRSKGATEEAGGEGWACEFRKWQWGKRDEHKSCFHSRNSRTLIDFLRESIRRKASNIKISVGSWPLKY